MEWCSIYKLYDDSWNIKIIKNKMKKTYFFGWTNIKWFITEIVKIYSSTESYFSKKRIESGIAFVIAQYGMITYFNYKYLTMDMYDMLLWAGAEFSICGYIINGIQAEKKLHNNVPQVSNEKEDSSEADGPLNS